MRNFKFTALSRSLLVIPLVTSACLFSTSAAAEENPDLVEKFQPPKVDKSLPEPLQKMHRVTNDTYYDKKEQGVQQVRLKTLRQAAFSWGVQEGLYWRYNKIVDLMNNQSIDLHRVFSFNKFIVDGKMLMPSIIEASRVFEQTSQSQVRTVNISYTLDKPARLVPAPPTWRDYLVRRIDKPQKPHDVIFPRTSDESKVWAKAVNDGWESGVKQADDIFHLDLRKMQKEIEGMYRFRKLLAMGVVTMPKFSSSQYSVIALDNGKTININDVIYSITTQSDFTETDKWEPFFRTEGAR